MRARLLLVVALSTSTSLLLLASSCQATPLHLNHNERTRLAPSFLEPPSSEFGRRNIDHDLHGSNAQNDDPFGQALSGRPIGISKRSISDQRAHMDYAFFKRGDRESDSDDAERVSAGKRARRASDSDSGSDKKVNNGNDAVEASDSDDDVVEGACDIRKEVTQEWAEFEKILARCKREHYRQTSKKFNPTKDINEIVDKMLGPPSTRVGDDLSSLTLTNVPPHEVEQVQMTFEEAFRGRFICGWATASSVPIGGHWHITVIRYVPEGGWRDAYKTFTERPKRKATRRNSSSSDSGAKVVKFNFERLGWSSNEQLPPRAWLIREQWFSRPEGKTDLIFFNVPQDQAARVRTFITEKWGSNDIPEVEELNSEKEGMCLLRLRGNDEFRSVH